MEGGDLAAVAHRDAVALELADQVVGHRLAQVGAAMEQRHERSSACEPDGGLPGGVAAADDGDPGCAAKLRLGWPGGVEDAQPFVVGQAVERQSPVVGAGCEHDGARGDLVLFFESDDVSSVAGLERDRAVRRRGPCSELACLADGAAGQLGAGDAGREAEVVLDPARRSGLTTERGALDDQRVEPFRGSVDGGGETCRATADDEQVDLLARRQLAADAERAQHLAPRRVVQLGAAGQPHERRLGSVRRRGLVSR